MYTHTHTHVHVHDTLCNYKFICTKDTYIININVLMENTKNESAEREYI